MWEEALRLTPLVIIFSALVAVVKSLYASAKRRRSIAAKRPVDRWAAQSSGSLPAPIPAEDRPPPLPRERRRREEVPAPSGGWGPVSLALAAIGLFAAFVLIDHTIGPSSQKREAEAAELKRLHALLEDARLKRLAATTARPTPPPSTSSPLPLKQDLSSATGRAAWTYQQRKLVDALLGDGHRRVPWDMLNESMVPDAVRARYPDGVEVEMQYRWDEDVLEGRGRFLLKPSEVGAAFLEWTEWSSLGTYVGASRNAYAGTHIDPK